MRNRYQRGSKRQGRRAQQPYNTGSPRLERGNGNSSYTPGPSKRKRRPPQPRAGMDFRRRHPVQPRAGMDFRREHPPQPRAGIDFKMRRPPQPRAGIDPKRQRSPQPRDPGNKRKTTDWWDLFF